MDLAVGAAGCGAADGGVNKQIAEMINVSIKTVEVHLSRVMQKMEADSLADLGRLPLTTQDIGFKLNQTPLSALTDIEGRKYASPNEAFKLLASDPTCQE